jgi:hypothetical protein
MSDVLAGPETAREHIANGLQLLHGMKFELDHRLMGWDERIVEDWERVRARLLTALMLLSQP